MAKEICEAINKRAGITDVDVSDFFDEGEEFDDDLEDVVEAQDNNMPCQITVVTNEVPVVTQPSNSWSQLLKLSSSWLLLLVIDATLRLAVDHCPP